MSDGTTMNVLGLETLLQGIAPPFQQDFLTVLMKEGFEITRGIPNLQLPQEIDDSIGWLADARFGDTWVRLHRLLVHAAVDGTLVDLSFGAGGS
ncbi:hypothetical protein [Geothrix sp. 21YS21S-2]|uniref:hypothetical protein n=1 Tax=Geothrix sp. 21YS21S-2 TaxID=3068893 RepID=UPI0027BA060F|nr:hypothetical protein [Geothrix sp. 21YS21S-2]